MKQKFCKNRPHKRALHRRHGPGKSSGRKFRPVSLPAVVNASVIDVVNLMISSFMGRGHR
jgi:hypothetical protein